MLVGSACLFVSGCFQGKGEAGLQIRGCRYGTHKHLISDVEWLILSTAGFFSFLSLLPPAPLLPESLDLHALKARKLFSLVCSHFCKVFYVMGSRVFFFTL